MTSADSTGAEPKRPSMKVQRTEDFAVTGNGDNAAWSKAPWVNLNKRGDKGNDYTTRIKAMYSSTGIYVLMDATDRVLTATMAEDYLNLWTEDVFEVFLWPDERYPIYFEYEISPLGYELPILIPNIEGKIMGWRPWHYENDRKIRKATAAVGGKKEPGASVSGWRAEVFIPYELLKPMTNVPPKPGSRWRANFYRMDYDDKKTSSWDWSRVGPSFHEFEKFGTIEFE